MRVLIGVLVTLVTLVLTVVGFEVRAQGTPEAAGCEGLAEYEAAILAAAGPFIETLRQEGMLGREVSTFSPSEWRIYSEQADVTLEAIKKIEPPAFAAEWHQAKIDEYGAYSSFALTMATSGQLAAMAYADVIDEIRVRLTDAAAAAISACPAFDDFLTHWDMLDGRIDRQATPVATPVM